MDNKTKPASFAENDWTGLIALCPRLSCKKGFGELEGEEWVEVLYEHPEFANHCESWNSFTGTDWTKLHLRHPFECGFDDECRNHGGFKKLDGKEWATLLSNEPDFIEDCEECSGFQKLDGTDWLDLLSAQGDVVDILAACADCDGWHKMNLGQRQELFQDRPDLEEAFAQFVGIQP